MNNQKLITSYIVGTLMIAVHNVLPILVLPGTIGVAGSLLMYQLQNNDEYLNMFKTLNIVNKNNVYPKLLGKRLIGKNIARVYSIPAGLDFSEIEKHKEKMENILHSSISISKENYTFILTKIKSRYPKVIKKDFTTIPKTLKFALGEDITGKCINLDLTGTEMHTGVFGATGTGKSVCLNIIMTQIIKNNYEVRVIDPKHVEFTLYLDYPKLSKYAVKIEEARDVLESTVKLMDIRYMKLAEAKCKSAKEYKGAGMEPVFLVADEYNALMEDKECKKLLFALLSRARAANIIVVIATQRPSADVLPGIIRCNLKNTISFQTETNVDSEIVTGQKGNYMAHTELKNPGEGFLKVGSKFTLFKSYYLTDDEIMAQIKDRLTGAKKRIENVNKPKCINNSKKDVETIQSLI
jgi:hypothetical protein